MPDLNDESLKKLLGDDPIATSVSVRIRQDEQTLTNLERRFNSIKKEAEGIVKALKEAGVYAGKLGTGGGRGGKTVTNIGSTPVQGATFTPTPIDRGQGTITGMNQRGQTTTAGGGGGGNIFTRAFQATQPAPDGTPTIGSTRMAAANDTMNAMIASMDARIDRNYQYSLSADRMNMLYQQMKGMSQTAIQDTYRQPLSKYMLGQGGINSLLALEATTGMSAAQQARSVEALRISSGFSVNAQQAASTLEQLASPQVANRMFMMTGMSIVKPGGGYRSMDELMRNIVKTQGLTDPRILQGAKAPGSVTRANLSMIGVTGELQNQILQYAEQNLAYKQKGGTGMYDPASKEHQKIMGIDQNFALQKERTDQLRVEREEQFYSRQADNFADLERQTQSLVRTLAALEDKISGIFGTRISTRVSTSVLSRIGNSLLPGGLGDTIGKGVGLITGLFNRGDPDTSAAIREKSKGQGSSGGGFFGNLMSNAAGKINKGISSAQKATASSITGNSFSGVKGGGIGSLFGARTGVGKGVSTPGAFVPGPTVAGGQGGGMMREIMMAYTPVYGPDGQRTTLAELTRHLYNMHPDAVKAFQNAAMAAHAAGTIIGFGDADRTRMEQHAGFLDAYQQVDYPADKEWDGKHWKLREGKNPVASPDSPYANHVNGIAFDIIGDKKWMNDNAHKFGLKGFAHMGEDWHFELEVSGQRGAEYNATTGWSPSGQTRYGKGGVGYPSSIPESQIITSLAERGLVSTTWIKNVNGKSQQVGIEFLPVQGGGLLSAKGINSLSNGIGASTSRGIGFYANRATAALRGGGLPMDEEGRLLGPELMQLYKNVGFTERDLVEMFSVQRRESGGKSDALNPVGEHSMGLLQINVADKANLAFIKSLGFKPEDLNNPVINAQVAYAMMQSDRSRGGSGFSPWGPYKGMHHMTGTKWRSAAQMALELGLISSPYTGPQDYGGMTAFPTIKEWEASRGVGGVSTGAGMGPLSRLSLPEIGDPDPNANNSPRYTPSLFSNSSNSNGAYPTYGDSTGNGATLVGGNTITVAPTININTSGGNLDQDLERMARKVAMMLEQEVNRTMMRRS